MPLILNGTTGVSGVDGTAGTPAAQGSDTNTGVFYGTDTVSISTGGTARVVVNSSGQTVLGAGTASLPAVTTTGDTNTGVFFPAADTVAFAEGGVESARFDSSGNLLVGTTSNPYTQTKAAVSGGTFYNQRAVTISTSGTTLFEAIGGIMTVRANTTGGTALIIFDVTTGVTLVSQSGSIFTTSAPTANQIQISVGSTPFRVIGTAGSSKNGETLNIGTIICQ